jgi:ankyrin repeat protein
MIDIVQAVIAGNLQDVETALKSGVSVNTQGQDGLYLIQFAAMANQPKVFDLLIQYHASVNAIDHHHNTPLYYACRAGGSFDFIQKIISDGATINAQNELGQTASHVSARINNVGGITALAQHGADLNIKDHVGKTPLIDSVVTKHPDITHVLLQFPVAIDAGDNYGNTALHYAAQQQNASQLIQSLVDHHANINSKNIYGETPLHLAAHANNLDAVKALVLNHADLTIKDNHGTTALQEAMQANQTDVVKIIQGKENSPIAQLKEAAMEPSADKSQPIKIADVLQMGNDEVLSNKLGTTQHISDLPPPHLQLLHTLFSDTSSEPTA